MVRLTVGRLGILSCSDAAPATRSPIAWSIRSMGSARFPQGPETKRAYCDRTARQPERRPGALRTDSTRPLGRRSCPRRARPTCGTRFRLDCGDPAAERLAPARPPAQLATAGGCRKAPVTLPVAMSRPPWTLRPSPFGRLAALRSQPDAAVTPSDSIAFRLSATAKRSSANLLDANSDLPAGQLAPPGHQGPIY